MGIDRVTFIGTKTGGPLSLTGLSEGYCLKFGFECLDEAVLLSVGLLLAAVGHSL